MILTVTLNPSVDMNYKLDTLAIDTVNRVSDVTKTAGGKGLNVTRVLRQLNEPVAASGFVGGHLGAFIEEEVEKLEAEAAFLTIEGQTRNCIAIIHEGKQTEILEAGPAITEADKETFIAMFKQQIADKKIITISGSLPKGLAKDFYNTLLEIAYAQGVPVILDTSGASLEAAVKDGQPHVIKPNEEELAALIGSETETSEQIISALKKPLFAHIPYIFVTRGAKGAIVKVEDTIYEASIPKVDVINAVGSGDSVVAGIARALAHDESTEDIIKTGLTLGTLNAMEEKTGHINPEKIDDIQAQITVTKVQS